MPPLHYHPDKVIVYQSFFFEHCKNPGAKNLFQKLKINIFGHDEKIAALRVQAV
jgi:hypothetical protein